MPTYDVVFIVSDLDYREFDATNEYSTKHRAFAIKDYVNQTSFALNFGADVVKTLNHYLNVPYTLPKLDHSVIPGISCDRTYIKCKMIFNSDGT